MSDDVIDDHRFDNLLRLQGASARVKKSFVNCHSGSGGLVPHAQRIISPVVEEIKGHYSQAWVARRQVVMVASWWSVNSLPHPGDGCLSVGSRWAEIYPDMTHLSDVGHGPLRDKNIRRLLEILADHSLGLCWSRLLSDVVFSHRYGQKFSWVADYIDSES